MPFIFNGDTYLDLEVDRLESLWQKNHLPTIVLREVPDTGRFGKVELVDCRIVSFNEKGTTGPGLINAGTYVLPSNALDGFAVGRPFSLETDYFATHLEDVDFRGFVSEGRFIDIGIPSDYELAQTALKGLI